VAASNRRGANGFFSLPHMTRTEARPAERHFSVAIVGAVFSGIGMAVQLRRAGMVDFVVFERRARLRWIWQHKRTPARRATFPRTCTRSPSRSGRVVASVLSSGEILEYLHRSRATRVDDRIRAGPRSRRRPMTRRRDLDARVRDADVYTCDVLIIACGQLSRRRSRRSPGFDRFRGPVFHRELDHDVELAGRRVAVVGTGASAVQFVPPVAERAAHLDVYQRSAPGCCPAANPPYRRWFRRLNDRVPASSAPANRHVDGQRADDRGVRPTPS